MTNLVYQYLKKNGPSLSSEVVQYLIQFRQLSQSAARQHVSRAKHEIMRLDLSFPRRTKFLFLSEQAGTGLYWSRLEKALLDSNSVYGLAIVAISERGGIIPKEHFEIASGSPIRQQRHLAAQTVLTNLIAAKLLKEIQVDGIGSCIYLGLHTNHVESLIPGMRARLLVEDIILRGVKSWMRNLGFVSYNQVSVRNTTQKPKVSTTAWDMCSPSYLSPLVSFKKDSSKPRPGFVVCDILLSEEVSEVALRPFLNKLAALRNLRNVGKQFPFFVANSFSKDAFNKLKSMGISPATTSAIFDNETTRATKELISLFSAVAEQAVSPNKIDEIFKSLGKIEGAASRLRGAFFEYIVADAMRSEYSDVRLNKHCQTSRGVKEADVICSDNKEIKFIEGKGLGFNRKVSLADVNYWLTEQIPIFKDYVLRHPDWKDKQMVFEIWTTSTFDPDAIERLELAKLNTSKYRIEFRDVQEVTTLVNNTSNKALIKTFNTHFLSHPLRGRE